MKNNEHNSSQNLSQNSAENTLTDTSKEAYTYFFPITTRWMDNDIFGHVNNVNYYSYFDTVVNQFLIENAGFEPTKSEEIGFIVSSQCQYLHSIAYPDKLIGAFRVNKIGNSSVEYGVAIFKKNSDSAAATGQLTHVFVNRQTEKPTPINSSMRTAMQHAMLDA
nr:thioesterase family protein [Thalassotalea crassostreae]